MKKDINGQKRTKIIFFGTAEFAVPALEALFGAGYEIVAVITQPDKPAGRKKVLTPSPVKLAAQKLGLPVLQPQSLKDPEFLKNLKPITYNLKPDLGIVAAYGKLIPPEIFNLPKCGTLNIHPSLLPKYRGPSPIQTAILNSDTETGVTIMKIDEEMDHGDKISNIEYRISNIDTYQTLHNELAKLGADLLIKTLPDYLTGKIKPVPQDHSQATFTKKFTSADGEIKPDETTERAYNKIRALNPEPGTFVWLKKGDKKLRLKILEAEAGEVEPLGLLRGSTSKNSGGLLFFRNGQLALQLKNGYIILETVQPEGKKPMSGQDFARGYLLSS